MKHKNFWIYGIVIFAILGLGGAIAFGIIPLENLPSQFYGALVGTVITAIITILLLQGQTQTEENKERNVKVFEKKSEVFNDFIEQLWEIWEDRTVSLDELNILIKIVAKNIIPYAKPETSKAILQELNKIADKIKSDKSDSADEDATKQIQNSVFSIINTIANEIGLGGKIDALIADELIALEKRVVPVLNKNSFLQQINKIVSDKSNKKLRDFEFTNNVLWWQIEKTGVWLAVGLIDKVPYITFWSRNKQYDKYKYIQTGKFKEWILGYEKFEMIELQKVTDGIPIPNDNTQELGKLIIRFYEDKIVAEDKTIRQIIEECVDN